jgi:hypothetical protein
MSESDFRKPLTIDSTQVSGNLTNFPVTVHLKNDSDLSNNAQSSGDDIRFKDSNGNQLSHEIESYDGSTGTLWAHVKIPSLSSSSDTTIFIFYGDANASNQQNASDVWTDGYEAVYHLNEKASGTGTADVYQDSTANNNDGDDFVSASGQGGQINEGQEFDGVDDFIQAPDYGDLSDWTLELWLNPTDWTPGDIQTFFFDAVVQGGEISFRIRDDSGQNRIEIGGGAALGGHLNFNVSGVTGWHSVAYTQDRDSNTRLGYFDGAQYGSFTSTNVADLDGTDVTIGGNGKNIRFYDGLIDEVRISSITRSPAAISTTFNNLDDPLSFFTVGTQSRLASASVAGAADKSATKTLTATTATDLAGTGDETAAATLTATEATALAGAADESAAGKTVTLGASDLAGRADQSAAGTRRIPGASTQAGQADIRAGGIKTRSASAGLAGQADQSVAGLRVIPAAVNFAGRADKTPVGTLIRTASAEVAGAGDKTAIETQTRSVTTRFKGAADMSVTVDVFTGVEIIRVAEQTIIRELTADSQDLDL